MKKTLSNGLRFSLVALIITTTILIVNNQTFSSEAEPNTEIMNNKLSDIDFAELEYLDVSEFSNTSHQISVSRVINANQYGYTTSRTEIRILNNGTNQINALNYTLRTEEYKGSHYFKITSKNDTNDEITKWETFIHNETTEIVIKFPAVNNEESVTLIIEMDHLNAISFDENDGLSESIYPYHFNMSFIPFLSLPITSYDLEWKVGTEIEVSVDNSTFQPTEANITGEFIQDSTEILFENIVSLSSINREMLNQSIYGGYNLSALTNLEFIPGYLPNLAENFTNFLSFDYYQSAGTFMVFSSLKTTVVISEWGTVYTTQEIVVKNVGLKSGDILSTDLGGPTFPSLAFQVPETAHTVGMRDNYGNLTPLVTVDPVYQKVLVEIQPRTQIEQGAEYYMILSYQEPSSEIINRLGGGKVQLITSLSMNFNWTIEEFELNILFPFGSSFNREKIQNVTSQSSLRVPISNDHIQKKEFLGIFNKGGISLKFENITPLSNREMKVEFGLNPFYQLNTPLSFTLFFLGIGVIYALVRNISFGFKPKKLALDEIPLDLIKNFVKSYEEKTAVREQILRLDRKRRSKNISAREYEQTRIILKNQQQRNDRAIVSVSRQLSEKSPRYRISMRSIEVAEASREDFLKNIESLESKKAQGRIGKEAYAKLKVDYDKKLRKANNDIDKVLIELRNLLTK
ncbi:MAG: hypothetical protein ACW99F_09575 [Candidatus Hodarchaeales archaeon]